MKFYIDTSAKLVTEEYLQAYSGHHKICVPITRHMLSSPSRKGIAEIFKWLDHNKCDYNAIRLKYILNQSHKWTPFPVSQTFFEINFQKSSDATLFKLRWQ